MRKVALFNAPDFHVHSTFSTYDGMGSPKDVVERAVELGWGAVTLTEHGWLGSAPSLYQAAKAAKIKPIVGCEMYVVPDDILGERTKETRYGTARHLTVLALTYEGYRNLVVWNTEAMRRENFYDHPRISIDRMIELAPFPLHHNAILSGCINGELCHTILTANGNADVAAQLYVESMRSVFPNFYIEIQNHELGKFMDRGLENYDQMIERERLVRNYLLALARGMRVPILLTNDSHFQSQQQRKAHLAMLARKDHSRQKDDTAKSFTDRYVYWGSYMRSMEIVADTLPRWAREEALENARDLVQESELSLTPLDRFSYSMPSSGYRDPIAEVRRRCRSRLKHLARRHGSEAVDRFEYELSALGEFAHYLLLVSDIVHEARKQGIYSWTRGSAANSVVCFCLKIHNIDPIHYKLLFERFVNPARKKLPDIDVDFEGQRQPDVVRLVKEMMAEREPGGGVRGVCTYNTVANRAAFRLMATSAGVPEERVDEMAKLLPQMIDSGMVTSEEEAYEILKEDYPDLHDLAERVFDAVANVSQHACAFALGTGERPLDAWVPNYLIASSGADVTQYNMKAIEEMGFLKLDLLKLDTLTIMHNVARMLGKDMKWLDEIMEDDLGSYGAEDDEVYAMLTDGRTTGIHTMQGKVQRKGCIDVVPENDFDLVAIQALYRPSGTRTGNAEAYVRRRHGREEWESVNEFVAKYIDESYGIPIYQEQIMEMGVGMGMTGEEIDDLYKAIKTAKGIGRGAKELFDKFEPTFRKYAAKIFSDADADRVWKQWHDLQGYTFNRGHATSYALLALKTAWLKCHYPREFFAALLERFPDNPRYVAGAIVEGFRFERPDINYSGAGFSPGSDDKTIRIGLLKIYGVGPAAAGELVRNQPFASVDDLRERTSSMAVKEPTIEALRKVGALDSLGIEGDDDDVVDYELLNFIPQRPKAFKGVTPKIAKRTGGSWEFLGLERGAKITDGKRFCAKVFWLPPVTDNLQLKSAVMGNYSAWLLKAVDQNGLPFDLVVSEKKDIEVELVRLLAKSRGAVICAEGQVAMPFLRGGNTSFKMWGIAGAENGRPQMWHVDDATAKKVAQLARKKRDRRR